MASASPFEISSQFHGGMEFRTVLNGHEIVVDAGPEHGGADVGPRPKPLVLVALACCTGMDTVSILRKMKIPDDSYTLRIDTKAESSEDHPVVYTSIAISFHFSGEDLPRDRVERAVTLSQERYCGVTAMLSRSADLSWSIVYD